MIVTNRDPNARAGCAVALGCIHSQVGGMAAGYHLKTIHGILMSLVADPHPTVHFWALEALSKVADSAGLTFSGYVSSTLGMLAQLYVADTHDEEVASVATSNLELELSTTAAIARCIDSLINVLGPDLQDMSKARDLIFTLVRQFQAEGDSLVLMESLRCLEHLSLYAAGHMEYAAYVRRLQGDLTSSKPELRDVAIDGLYNLMKRDANDVIKTADAGLDDQLWLVLDAVPNHEGIQNLIKNWLNQTALSDTVIWVQRCQNVLTKTKLRQDKPPARVPKTSAVDLQDEEVAGFAASAESNKDESATTPSSGQELLKWQVRMFAMSCLSDLLAIVGKGVLQGAETPAETALVKCIADVVRMAFSASTSNVVELRVWGLRIIDQVLKVGALDMYSRIG
jgi:HEAT repeat-containing protein 5